MSTSLDETICAYFVNNTNGETDADQAIAEQYDNALKLMREQLADTQVREIRPSDGFPLIASGGLTKQDVFVLAHFKGDLFAQLQMTKALVLGPPCIVECLSSCEPVPLGTSPIYGTAMRDLQISATGIDSKEKEHLKQLINWMGGHYFQNFGRNITHLISNTIKSNKYEHATLNDVPIMHADWVQSVWECTLNKSSSSSKILATDPQFDKYLLPTFFGANITCSGLDATRKDAVMRLVNENGGIYHRAFRSQLVDIVITEQSKTESEKYKAALRFKKDILLPEWIFDSHKRGYALPTKQYEVRPRKQVSTPTKAANQTHAADNTQLSDLSRISFISAPGRRMCSDNTTLNETVSSNCSSSSSGKTSTTTSNKLLKQATSSGVQYQQTLAEISPRKAKRAGNFLDGCCIYLSGFRSVEREKLNRVLNTGGATRYDDPHEGLTHIIVGQLLDAEYRQWKEQNLLSGVMVVQLDWLLESIRAGHIVSPIKYRISLPHGPPTDAASPASKRTLRSMNHSFKQPSVPVKKKLFEQPDEQEAHPEPTPELLTHYSQEQEPAMPLPAASSTQLNAPPSAPDPIPAVALPDLSASTLSIDFDKLDYFMGASVYVHEPCFTSELYDQMLSECRAAQGCLVPPTYTDLVDYAIVSFEQAFDELQLPVRARHVVTELYLESCMKQNKLLSLEYYHRPVPPSAQVEPLCGMTIVVSIYAGLERDFINALAELLGAQLNKAFVKKERPLLVCSSAEGSKYEGALKWGYPVVNADWLVQCAQRGEKLPYADFLVGKCTSEFPISPGGLKESNKNTNKTVTRVEHPPLEDKEEEDKEQQPELTPLRNPRISELVMGMPSAKRRSSGGNSQASAIAPALPPDSPHTPLNQKSGNSVVPGACNFEFLEQVVQRLETSQARNCVRQIIREMRENQTPELERIRRQACTPVNRRQYKQPVPGIPDFCLTPEFQQRMADDFERRWRLPKQPIKPDTPIAVIRQRVMRITCETLGIDYNASEEEEEEEPMPMPIKDQQPPKGRLLFQPASTNASPAVGSPFVPSTQSPCGGREGVGAAAAAPAVEDLASSCTINFDKISFEETTTTTSTTETAADNSLELKQITDFLKSRETRRSSLKRDHDGLARSEAQFVQPFESEGFALAGSEDMVGWRDPAEFQAGAKRNSDADLSRMRYPGTPCFSISCGDNEDMRTLLMERIRVLGGKICQNLSNYDPSCTHLLCERPNRGEKLLGCMAAGKWVLNISYIEQCHACGKFLDETQYEWGNPKALNLPSLPPEEQLIAAAAHRWRVELNTETDGGAFSDYRVILSLQERNLAAIKNVLRAGGAEILEPSTPFSSDASAASATHCFVDAKKVPLAAADFAYLQERGVQIMSQMCINSYLMGGRQTNLEKYVLRQ